MQLETYLSEAKHAVTGLFEILHFYTSLREEINIECRLNTYDKGMLDDAEHASETYEKEKAIVIEQALIKERESLDYSDSENIISGSLLQIAYMTIKKFSSNKTCEFCFKKNSVFKIGRTIKGVPIGLIILAGRHQYSHIDEKWLQPLNEIIFKIIGQNGLPKGLIDPAFDLRSPYSPISNNLLSIIGWSSYSEYHKDMMEMLS